MAGVVLFSKNINMTAAATPMTRRPFFDIALLYSSLMLTKSYRQLVLSRKEPQRAHEAQALITSSYYYIFRTCGDPLWADRRPTDGASAAAVNRHTMYKSGAMPLATTPRGLAERRQCHLHENVRVSLPNTRQSSVFYSLYSLSFFDSLMFVFIKA